MLPDSIFQIGIYLIELDGVAREIKAGTGLHVRRSVDAIRVDPMDGAAFNVTTTHTTQLQVTLLESEFKTPSTVAIYLPQDLRGIQEYRYYDVTGMSMSWDNATLFSVENERVYHSKKDSYVDLLDRSMRRHEAQRPRKSKVRKVTKYTIEFNLYE